MSILITKPISMPSVGKTGPNSIKVEIPATESKVIDLVECTKYHGFKWLVTITNAETNEALIQEVSAIAKMNGISHTRYGLTGDMVPHTLDVVQNQNGCMELTITNPSTTAIYKVTALRVQLEKH
jgi:hypothetical protein